MYKSVLYVSVLGALFGLAYSDFSCFSDKAKYMEDGFDRIFEDNHGDCKSVVREIITEYRQAIKDCSVPVSADKMEVVLEEVCDPDSELFNAVSQNALCLSLTTKNTAVCFPKKADLDPSLSVKDSCEKRRDEYFTCLGDTVGKPCGTNAFKAMKRIYEARRTLTDGICDEIATNVDSEDDSEASIHPRQPIAETDDSDEALYWMYWIFGVAVVFSIILTVIKKLLIKNLNEKPFNV